MTACIVGWAHTPFGKLEAETVETLVVRVANEALEHAGIEAGAVDEILLGHFNAGFSPQDFTASIVLQAHDGFRFKPATARRERLRDRSAACTRPSRPSRRGAPKSRWWSGSSR
jgi:acetyl-CoA C-acetyltransferase